MCEGKNLMGTEVFTGRRLVFATCLGCLALVAAERQTSPAQTTEQFEMSAGATAVFSEVEGVIPLEARSRRKWDNAVVADLDQDGHMDLLLTEHSYRARLFWNNGGVFSEPYDVVMGDTHGVATGDYDLDGRLDLIISRGGGGGKKPRNPVAFHVNRDRSIEGGEEFAAFERTRGRAAKLIDGDHDGSLDLVLSAFPLKSQTNGANDLYVNAGEGQFDFVSKLPYAKWMGFRTLVTDFNNDGVFDLIFYGGDNMVAARGEEGLAFCDVSQEVLGKLADTTFVSSIAEIDFDNDGDFDLFVTRADHPFEEKTYFDSCNCRFAYYIFAAFVKDVNYQYDLKIDGDFQMGNLQMAYPDFDVFVGADKRKLEFQVDRHGQKDFALKPDEAEGWPSDTSENGLNIGYLGDGVWRIGGETKSSTAGVVHNVKSCPGPTPLKNLPARLFENRDGVFADVTSQLGISVPEQTTSSAVGDFDNDGWSDVFVVRYGNPSMRNEQILYLNQDGKAFVRADNSGVVSRELGATGGGAEAVDYDNDGDLDLVYANERGRWHLFTNNGLKAGQQNFVVIRVGKSPSKQATAQGAVLTLNACGNTYRRVVGATSAAFSHSMNTHLHVGLGTCDRVESASVRWSNGETESIRIDAVNRSVVAGHVE